MKCDKPRRGEIMRQRCEAPMAIGVGAEERGTERIATADVSVSILYQKRQGPQRSVRRPKNYIIHTPLTSFNCINKNHRIRNS